MKIDLNKSTRSKVKERIKYRNIRNAGKCQISVFKSNLYTYAMLVDKDGRVLKTIGSKGFKGNKTEGAFEVGIQIGKFALGKKIGEIFFNRSGYRYHGRIKAVAEGARKAGIKF